MHKPLVKQIEEIKEKLLQQDKTNEEILLNQSEILVSQEYNSCLLELQTM